VDLFEPHNQQTQQAGLKALSAFCFRHSLVDLKLLPLFISHLMETPIRNSQPIDPSDRHLHAPEAAQVVAEETVRLLEERLIVDRHKRKVGEVVVRKTVETQIVEVPVRREKLIVEQIGAETRQLAEIDLGSSDLSGVELAHALTPSGQTVVSTEVHSLRAAHQLLDAIASLPNSGNPKVRLEFVLDDSSLRGTYQELLSRYRESD
jgi:hypothetical protein